MEYAIPFTKASGAGNDFVLLDNRNAWLPADLAALARALCSRPFGVGADGMLVLEKSARADFLMRYFNADGSSGGMCGNGGRCIARYASILGAAGKMMTFEALDFLYKAEVSDRTVSLWMKEPTDLREITGIQLDARMFTGHFVDTGAPHLVVFAEGISSLDVAGIGRKLRFHDRFQPEGTNVDFVERQHASTIRMRTYERGVEAETLACGTGSVACAAVAARVFGLAPPVIVLAQSGESLIVSLDASPDGMLRPVLTGSAHMLFDGAVTYDDVRASIF